MNELALFAGAGGGILGGKLLGWKTVCAVEFDEHARNVLVARQNDGCLQPFPIWDDVRTFDGKPWRDIVDVVSGGFPCQDISCANTAGADGLDGERSGLWKEMFRIICDVRPFFVLVENSPMLTIRGLGVVCGDLAALGYDARWGVVSAADAGAPHLRERLFVVAYTGEIRCNPGRSWQSLQGIGLDGSAPVGVETPWNTKPTVDRVAYGLAHGLDRLAAIGNGQIPAVAAKAWHVLCQRAAAGTLRKRPAQHTTAAVCNTAGH
jgi:DNA (cytosine-5)-methyltransferase 1